MSKLDQIRALAEAKRARMNSGGTREGPRAERQEERERTQRPYAGGAAQVKNVLGAGTNRPISGKTVQEPSVDSRSVVKADGRATKPGGIKATPPGRLKRGRPKIVEPRPWEAAGMSRRSWYRRQKEKAK